jgi:hypothetical protein
MIRTPEPTGGESIIKSKNGNESDNLDHFIISKSKKISFEHTVYADRGSMM